MRRAIVRAFLGALGLLCANTAHADQGFTYGRHYPNGQAAADFMYGNQGMYRSITNLAAPYNYYTPSQYNNLCDTSQRKNDLNALVAYGSDPTHQSTTPDKDCHLLLDLNGDGSLDRSGGGYAFIEHNGIGDRGVSQTNSFNNFWFDDNWLARYVALAYSKPQPYGLWAPNDFVRWAIVGGSTSQWNRNRLPYTNNFFDQISLIGLYDVSTGDCAGALSQFNTWVSKSGATYDSPNQQYNYPNVSYNYYYGLFKIFTEKTLKYCSYPIPIQDKLIQHNISIRSKILDNQVVNGSALLGWITDIGNSGSLINTETTSAQILGLGAGGRYAFEAGRAPMAFSNNNYFVRPQNWISAVIGQSTAGTLVFGPSMKFPVGAMTVDFFLRAPTPVGTVAGLDIYDGSSDTVLALHTVTASEIRQGNIWTKITVSTSVTNLNNSLQFRVYWPGGSNLDVAYVQVR